LGQMEKPDVDQIEGLSPAISIEQRSAGSNPRSTVATVTEIYDYLRLLEARKGSKIQILAPVVRGRKGEYRKEFSQWQRLGFVRARVDGVWVELESEVALDKKKKHTIEIVVDRLTADAERRSRIHESLETATRLGEG